ncbi:MAG: pyruvate kinase alpha/beta domain-containing protein [Candidatus Hodarchaeota archaeon]
MVKREVFYFEKSGEHNTDHVIKSVKERTGLGDLSYIAVASNSGKTALKLSKMLRNTDVPIICVTESSQRRDWEAQ